MNGESSSYDKVETLLQGGSSEPQNVPLEYLRNITNNFSDELLLGDGGFGTVYKGVLKNGDTIAVKKLNSSIPGVQDRQFENEASHLMRLKHPNVVLLVGWCSETEYIPMEYNGKYICAEKQERLLCLEYMPKGNLREYLSAASSGLVWDTRLKIIEGICYGLRYLHEQWQPNVPIVHMDLKPANILLDNNMVPKIADFGLSRLFREDQTWTCTINRDGTLGYMSPEYINRGLISTKSDIFSLGVIIIEIVTGQRDYPDETETSFEGFIEMVLNNWSRRKRVGVSFGLSLEVESQQIRQCIQIGLDCVKADRFKRPTISQIIETLHGPETADSRNIKGVHRPQSDKRDGNCGETRRMERLTKKHTPAFSIDENFTLALHHRKKTVGPISQGGADVAVVDPCSLPGVRPPRRELRRLAACSASPASAPYGELRLVAPDAKLGAQTGRLRPKRRRLTDEQARFLELSFRNERKLETPRKVQLAAELGLDTKQVAVWFQNRRAYHKSKLMEEEFSKLRTVHDAVVLENCHLETELLKMKDRLAEPEGVEDFLEKGGRQGYAEEWAGLSLAASCSSSRSSPIEEETGSDLELYLGIGPAQHDNGLERPDAGRAD